MMTISAPEILKNVAYWGPGMIIAALMIYAFYRLADKFIEKFVSGLMSLGSDFVKAQKEQAVSLAKMAQGTEGLRECINTFVNRDNQEHREMILLQKYIRGEMEQMAAAIQDIPKQLTTSVENIVQNREGTRR